MVPHSFPSVVASSAAIDVPTDPHDIDRRVSFIALTTNPLPTPGSRSTQIQSEVYEYAVSQPIRKDRCRFRAAPTCRNALLASIYNAQTASMFLTTPGIRVIFSVVTLGSRHTGTICQSVSASTGLPPVSRVASGSLVPYFFPAVALDPLDVKLWITSSFSVLSPTPTAIRNPINSFTRLTGTTIALTHATFSSAFLSIFLPYLAAFPWSLYNSSLSKLYHVCNSAGTPS